MTTLTDPAPPKAALPPARGPLSSAVLSTLTGEPRVGATALPSPAGAEPFGDDLQLALLLCYELHYQGLPGVPDQWEWDPELLRFRGEVEAVFLTGLRARLPEGDDVSAVVEELLVEPIGGGGPSRHLARRGEWWQMQEFLAHRSVYHLKEADPHAWVIPRLRGRAKAALVAVEYDEFGGGHAERAHSRLYTDLLEGAGLDPGYLRYLPHVPAPTLAWVNLMSLLGLHRSLRGALVGHFAAAEITTAPSARRMVNALRRFGADKACVHFYAEHIEADAVHEQVMRHEVIDDLLTQEPALAPDVVFGIRAAELVEDDFARHLNHAWEQGSSSLRVPLPGSLPVPLPAD
ncbi:iron-containing redox enzyme family protein [Streptomyces sp. XM4193]|uniref:iron-containing redox enzyme family protein n=1 Tax=Streptomyces sp. XM4193 TaxID=2929782 RepID=UPI001FFA0820|nr:iron-containing redox enzyme family protein [Streptomyces sp. XM4193]MCK1798143.1 iron-containing redox enzyme family protein [Streptomyces sp. XM4193]